MRWKGSHSPSHPLPTQPLEALWDHRDRMKDCHMLHHSLIFLFPGVNGGTGTPAELFVYLMMKINPQPSLWEGLEAFSVTRAALKDLS